MLLISMNYKLKTCLAQLLILHSIEYIAIVYIEFRLILYSFCYKSLTGLIFISMYGTWKI
jgi:hypothetical protein